MTAKVITKQSFVIFSIQVAICFKENIDDLWYQTGCFKLVQPKFVQFFCLYSLQLAFQFINASSKFSIQNLLIFLTYFLFLIEKNIPFQTKIRHGERNLQYWLLRFRVEISLLDFLLFLHDPLSKIKNKNIAKERNTYIMM